MDKQSSRQQQQQQSSRHFNIANVEQGFEKDNQCCLTRSETYALCREVINKRKHDNDLSNVWTHIFEPGFQEQLEYIRANLDKAFITVGGEQPHCKRLFYHAQKIEKIFNLTTSLENEYKTAYSKYEHHNERFN
ncbi:late expression factor 11 [Spodoptera frugiperda multiple nucleopolyhedrovirus]|uniref:Late expression factor 11 n=1 Tax=Spodoptera frugiperda nuclear polyhedrosis virus TaxID=10455 RepID=A1YJB0_NPVSF|nr:late expression factor 11 [Spodoptera frugiperda multiple nucleopolyhedrovirus]ABM45830.1 late expression factor 11 [Spodoptera frugiperda multiple nucleopolyhedrovirus]ACA02677.1 LEF-11 [Spodoptera frugiperda multiple nucleopolyhedrovirus]ADV91353.1 lef-11 [Spodoptera frugiperda multiple nucleopolyhedrovirus]AFH59064.1 lef-11 [Spodoptera frugiperda multiple nucleopolyhedrovirus]AIW01532.1 late expression factor 11 protein [Spodoptera frugiperda multiple nucleopolyhedrovirus]